MGNTRNTNQLEALDKLQRQDHDLIVRIEEVVKNIAIDVKELKDGTTMRLAMIETNIALLEKRVDRWETSMKAVKWTVGIIATIVSFVLANLSGALDLFRR